ncbi:hypothetical protein OG568_53240 (plasmid) [Streptomyces sp. NBC_01450]|uniref:hypothetical protein n=1 Tax=Streptomyces sp. NBC_01450 TaxID=2903871 RepID=UPI002E33AE07|nr:hypothetical protein [Streptomyces sp. NBC_01450]
MFKQHATFHSWIPEMLDRSSARLTTTNGNARADVADAFRAAGLEPELEAVEAISKRNVRQLAAWVESRGYRWSGSLDDE